MWFTQEVRNGTETRNRFGGNWATHRARHIWKSPIQYVFLMQHHTTSARWEMCGPFSRTSMQIGSLFAKAYHWTSFNKHSARLKRRPIDESFPWTCSTPSKISHELIRYFWWIEKLRMGEFSAGWLKRSPEMYGWKYGWQFAMWYVELREAVKHSFTCLASTEGMRLSASYKKTLYQIVYRTNRNLSFFATDCSHNLRKKTANAPIFEAFLPSNSN